jgi:acetoin utilization protein AcuB
MSTGFQVRDWMTHDVFTTTPTTSLRTAYEKMLLHSLRHLPVVDHGKLVGIISQTDVFKACPSEVSTLSVWELNYLWDQLTVVQVMKAPVLTIYPDAKISEAARRMLDYKISSLPVTEPDGTLIGIITSSDLYRVLLQLDARMAIVS